MPVPDSIEQLIARFREDRGIEPYGRLRDLATGGEVYTRLMALYNQADAPLLRLQDLSRRVRQFLVRAHRAQMEER